MRPPAPAQRHALLVPLAVALLLSVSTASASAVGTTPQPPETGATVTGTACLVGSWDVDPAADSQRLKDYLGASATDITVTTGGDGTMTFTGDTVTYAYENETVTQAFTVDGHRVVISSTGNGTTTDPYTATQDTIEAHGSTPEPDLDWEYSQTVDGVEGTLPGDGIALPGGLSAINGEWRYECTGDELVFYWLDGPTVGGDVIQVYSRRPTAPSPTQPGPATQPVSPTQPGSTHRAGLPAAAATPAVVAPAYTG